MLVLNFPDYTCNFSLPAIWLAQCACPYYPQMLVKPHLAGGLSMLFFAHILMYPQILANYHLAGNSLNSVVFTI